MRKSLASALALLIITASVAQAAITKGPYLQQVTKTSIVVMWETDSAAAGEVRLTTPAGQRTITAAMGTAHEVLVDGLSADTAYTYTVISGGATAPTGNFVTAPEASAPFMFVAYGDNRDGDAEHMAVVNAMRTVGADFGVLTGDAVASDSATEWQKFFDIEGPLLLSLPIFTSLGNHELLPSLDSIIAGLPPARYRKLFALPGNGQDAERNYSFTYGNTVFIGVDGNNAAATAQRDWLRTTLMAARANTSVKNIVVMGHHGTYSTSNHGGTGSAQSLWVPLFEQYNVELVLQGHDHTYEHLEKAGVHYVTLGGAGAPLYSQTAGSPDLPYSKKYVMVNHFATIRVDGDFMELRAQKPDGTVIDTFSIGTPVGPTPDGGVIGPTPDGGSRDGSVSPSPSPSGSSEAGVDPIDPGGSADSGCGCSAGGRGATGAGASAMIPLVSLLFCGILVWRVRKRRARRS